jgi:hypothetical protein
LVQFARIILSRREALLEPKESSLCQWSLDHHQTSSGEHHQETCFSYPPNSKQSLVRIFLGCPRTPRLALICGRSRRALIFYHDSSSTRNGNSRGSGCASRRCWARASSAKCCRRPLSTCQVFQVGVYSWRCVCHFIYIRPRKKRDTRSVWAEKGWLGGRMSSFSARRI